MKKNETDKVLQDAKKLMKDILDSLNTIKNTKTGGTFNSTYEICSALEKIINKL